VVAFANKKANGIFADLSGSRIVSSKPVAVVSGNQCAYVPETVAACDYLAEMELPTHTWGKEYHISRFIKRKKYSYIKIFAKEPNTKLYRNGNPVPFAVLQTVGGNKGTGYYEGRVLDDGSEPHPVIIKADKPISITQYNTGQTDDGVSSDPFQLVLTPIEQYQKEIVFNTPGIKGGQGFKENFINVVFQGNPDGTMPDDLEFATVLDGKFKWKSLKSVFGSTSEPFKAFPGDTNKFFAKIITLPGDGVYKIRAQKPFAAYAYGFDTFDSYAHPTSLMMNDISTNDTLPPTLFVKSENGSSADVTISDKSVSRIFLNPTTSSNYVLKTTNFISGQAKSVQATLEVQNPAQNASAEIVAVDHAGNHSKRVITYTAKAIAILTANEPDFGQAPAGQYVIREIIVRNTGNASATITAVIMPNDSAFKAQEWPQFPITIQPGGNRNFWLSFQTKTTGRVNDQLTFVSDADNLTVELRTVAAWVLETSKVDFGTMKVGESKTLSMRIENFAYSPVSILGIVKLDQQGFQFDNWPDTLTLKGGAFMELPVSFTADQAGTFTVNPTFHTSEGSQIRATVTAKVESATGIERVYDPSFYIAPNPATGLTTISLPPFKSQNPVVKVYNALGYEVIDFSGKVSGSLFNFDTRTLPNGAYFVRFTDGSYTLMRTFVVAN
ncbi:MAG TPA: choice-of-anchor D domain-containing protein, partial [Patescibacteria group bacterium]|nr:choice-of-anchor D domain-containing protein [Patescibacteria group bacterium]